MLAAVRGTNLSARGQRGFPSKEPGLPGDTIQEGLLLARERSLQGASSWG